MRKQFNTLLPLIAALLMTFGAAAVSAKNVHSKAGTSAFPFLKINVGARAVGMGGAFTGLADDESSLYYNPAGVVALEENRFILGYHNYFVDIQSGFAGVIWRLNEQNSMATYASYLNYGEFKETDELGEPTGKTFSGGDLLLATTFARRLSDNFNLGASAKFIYESLEEYSATGFAFDLGAKYTSDRERFAAGLMVQNAGAQLSALGTEKYDLPLTVRGGVSYRPVGLPLTVSSDLILPVDNDPILAIGGEYHELRPFYMRLGWNSFGSNYRAAGSDDSWAGLAVGVGFDFNRLHIAYAYTPAAELGNAHRITLTGRL